MSPHGGIWEGHGCSTRWNATVTEPGVRVRCVTDAAREARITQELRLREVPISQEYHEHGVALIIQTPGDARVHETIAAARTVVPRCMVMVCGAGFGDASAMAMVDGAD